jgi:hypothetical protein
VESIFKKMVIPFPLFLRPQIFPGSLTTYYCLLTTDYYLLTTFYRLFSTDYFSKPLGFRIFVLSP